MELPSFFRRIVERKLLALLIAISLIVLPLGDLIFNARAAISTPPAPASFTAQIVADAGPLPLQLQVPATAVVGDRVTFVLVGKNLKDLAGFQAVLHFDPAGLQFANASVSEEFAQAGGTLDVGPVEANGSVLLGSASCPVDECTNTQYTKAARKQPQRTGTFPLGSFSFLVRAPGAYEIQVADIQLVDYAGQHLFASRKVNQAATAATVGKSTVDITGNLFVNDSDASTVVDAWISRFEVGECAGPVSSYDLDQSGCLDIADVQMILAHWGEKTSESSLFEPQFLEGSAAETTLVVNSQNDTSDVAPGDGVCADAAGACTLRAALEESNVRSGPEVITFNIRNETGGCPNLVIIEPVSPTYTLHIDDPSNAGVTIDGYTQCNASANTQPVTGNAVIKIEIKGPKIDGVPGLYIHSGNNVVKGLALYDWSNQVYLSGGHASLNTIQGNFIGTNAANTYRTRFQAADADGLRIRWGAKNNTIGGTQPADRNIISGANQDGLGIQGLGADNNRVIGNYIGLRQDGTFNPNNPLTGADGVDIAGNAANNTIGGLNPGERNVISANGRDGIEISHEEGTNNNHVVGNFIGVNPAGNAEAPNGQKGVTFEDLANKNSVYRNVIAGNKGSGVRFYTVFEDLVTENFIGVLPKGLGPLDVVPVPFSVDEANLIAMPNGTANDPDLGISGVLMTGGSQHNVLRLNIIANHPEDGVLIDANPGYLTFATCEAYYNTISENRIYNNTRLGIRLRTDECAGTIFYPNQNIQPPVISDASTTTVKGTACSNCIVELFLSDKTMLPDPFGENAGEGKRLVGKGQADASGQFSIAVSGLAAGNIISGTSTDPNGNSSQFSQNVLVYQAPGETPTVPPTPTATPPPGQQQKRVYMPAVFR